MTSWKTFPDFLFAYIKHALGSGWGQKELAKPLPDRHEAMRWYAHLCEMQKGREPNAEGLCSMVPDGICSAYLLLAYDLYLLRNHGSLQKEVIRRLRIPDQFRGARYELFVAATFVRAGFDIEYEDESDPTVRHPEFKGRHRASSLLLEVEAKAKHRLEPSGAQVANVEDVRRRPRLRGLLRDAAGKKRALPLVVFVELGLPPEDATGRPSWITGVHQELEQVVRENAGRNPFDLVVFTNLPHQYGEPGEPDPARHFYAMWPPNTVVTESIIDSIGQALMQYGHVPNQFPSESNEVGV